MNAFGALKKVLKVVGLAMRLFPCALVMAVISLLPVTAPTITTIPVSVVYTVEQVASIYDTGVMPVVSGSALTGSEVVPFFDSVANVLVAENGENDSSVGQIMI